MMAATQRAARRSSRLAAAAAGAPVKRKGRASGEPAPKKAAAKPSGPGRDMEAALWAKGYALVAGVDEAGRGPLAGPVVAAAAVLPRNLVALGDIRLDDSKKMSEEEREQAYEVLTSHPDVFVGVSVIPHTTIDRINILQATMQAMDEAVAAIKAPAPVDAALVDGNRVPPRCADGSLTRHAAAVVKGDTKCAAIAAASIVAKVTRDRIMVAADKQYPAFGFAGHKGYPTAAHVAALVKHGPCEIHRLTFAPIKNML